jgi:hypothetical protein
MKTVRLSNRLPLLFLLFSPFLAGADLSTYRGFRLGTTLTAVVKYSGRDVSEVTTTHQRPARIEELRWRPLRFSSIGADPVEEVLFSFYNGQLFRILVDYDTDKTKGLTSEDIIEAVSTKYGTPMKPAGPMVLTSQFSSDTVEVVARWEDVEYSFNLVQAPYESTYKLLILSKHLNALADAALAEGKRLDIEEAPARLKLEELNATTSLNKDRQANKGNFRP